uniref:GRAM domain containing 4 n=1 Tax=Sus scrofa TaxID=9823 RepID=A0A8D1MIN2_PIG
MPTDYIRNGVLYVTENYLCFESSKSGSSKRNKVIRLLDITDIQKYKVLSVLPGSGMGIAVSTPSTQKVSAPRGGPEHGPPPSPRPVLGQQAPGHGGVALPGGGQAWPARPHRRRLLPPAAGVRCHGAQGRGLRDHLQPVPEDHGGRGIWQRQLVLTRRLVAASVSFSFNDLVAGKTGPSLDLLQ